MANFIISFTKVWQMSEQPPVPENDSPARPTLSDQHWRIGLAAKSSYALRQEVIKAVKADDSWRFEILAGLQVDWQGLEPMLELAAARGNSRMFDTIAKNIPGWRKESVEARALKAVKAGQGAILRHLVEKEGADIKAANHILLQRAASNGHDGIVAYLLAAGAEATVRHHNCLIEACAGGHLDVAKRLVAAGCDIHAQNDKAYREAIDSGSEELMLWLLQMGETSDDNNARIMEAAIENNFSAIVEYLTAKKPLTQEKLDAFFLKAVYYERLATAEVFIKKGANVDADNGKALHDAINDADMAMINFLLLQGAKTETWREGETPLTLSLQLKGKAVLQKLLQHGADPEYMGGAAFAEVRLQEKHDCVRLLIDAARGKRQKERAAKQEEFAAAFPGGYTVDDLRDKKGPSGECGLLIAARTGSFDKIILKATAGQLRAADLYLPPDGVHTVLGALLRHKSLRHFFAPAFWTDRFDDLKEAQKALPERYQSIVDVTAVQTEMNIRRLRRRPPRNAKGI